MDQAITALIKDYIYHINIGFVTIVQLPIDNNIFDRRKELQKNNETILEFHDQREVFQLHYQQLLPYLESWNSHVMLLCPGYIAEERVLSSMKHHINDVTTSDNKGAYDGHDSWVVLDYAREDSSCPLVGRLLRTSGYRGLYQYMVMFDTMTSISQSPDLYLGIKSQMTVYLMKPVLFKNPLIKVVEENIAQE